MVRALGWCHDEFSPVEPGRLCRGRERWIETFDVDNDVRLQRIVISGAEFSDDSARDARRGLCWSGIDPADVIRALFPGRRLLAWAEDAHPRKVPDEAHDIETYTVTGTSGPLWCWFARWSMECPDTDSVARALDAGADVFVALDGPPAADGDGSERERALGGVPGAPPADLAEPPRPHLPSPLRDALFLLTGFRLEGPPARRYQPSGIPAVLDHCLAVVLMHADKHAPCLGVYTREPLDGADAGLRALARERDVLAVPFAIPPMLARWDRALWELRQDWDEQKDGPFPVPAGEGWQPGWRWRHAQGHEE